MKIGRFGRGLDYSFKSPDRVEQRRLQQHNNRRSIIIVRLIIYGVLFAIIYFGIRRIIRDWRQRFRDLDKETRDRDLKERAQPGVVELKKDEDGVFRPKSIEDDNDK